jgi:hypothetical protein
MNENEIENNNDLDFSEGGGLSLQTQINKQNQLIQNVIIGVLIASVLIVVTVAVEVIISNKITQDTVYSVIDTLSNHKDNTESIQ